MTVMKRPSEQRDGKREEDKERLWINVLMRPSASAAINAATNESTFTQGKIYAARAARSH